MTGHTIMVLGWGTAGCLWVTFAGLCRRFARIRRSLTETEV